MSNLFDNLSTRFNDSVQLTLDFYAGMSRSSWRQTLHFFEKSGGSAHQTVCYLRCMCSRVQCSVQTPNFLRHAYDGDNGLFSLAFCTCYTENEQNWALLAEGLHKMLYET